MLGGTGDEQCSRRSVGPHCPGSHQEMHGYDGVYLCTDVTVTLVAVVFFVLSVSVSCSLSLSVTNRAGVTVLPRRCEEQWVPGPVGRQEGGGSRTSRSHAPADRSAPAHSLCSSTAFTPESCNCE